MMVVFVYRDGKVGHVDTPHAHLPVIRFPRPMRAFSAGAEYDLTQVGYTYDEFTRHGSNYDGVPIFCARGWSVEEAHMSILCPNSRMDIERADGQIRREVMRFVSGRYRAFVELGERHGALDDTTRDLKKQGLAHRFARLLVAIPMDGRPT
jgi:hypothetical protein